MHKSVIVMHIYFECFLMSYFIEVLHTWDKPTNAQPHVPLSFIPFRSLAFVYIASKMIVCYCWYLLLLFWLSSSFVAYCVSIFLSQSFPLPRSPCLCLCSFSFSISISLCLCVYIPFCVCIATVCKCWYAECIDIVNRTIHFEGYSVD